METTRSKARSPVLGARAGVLFRRCAAIAALLLAFGSVPPAAAEEPSSPALSAILALIQEGRFAEAETSARSLLARVEAESGADSLQVAEVLHPLVTAMFRGGKANETETLALAHRELEIRQAALGPSDPGVAKSLGMIGVVYYLRADYASARVLFERGLAVREGLPAVDDGVTEKLQSNLGNLLADIGDLAGARTLYERVDVSLGRTLGPDHFDTLNNLGNLATVLQDLGDHDEARETYERTIASYEKTLGPESPYLAIALGNFAELLDSMGDKAAARETQTRALSIRQKTLPANHHLIAYSLAHLASLKLQAGDHEESRQMFDRSLRIREERFGPAHPTVAISLTGLADVAYEQGRYAEARPLYERALSIRRAKLGPDHPLVAKSLIRLARLQLVTSEVRLAVQNTLSAESIVQEQLRRLARSLSEREALDYSAILDSGLDVVLTGLALQRPAGRATGEAAAAWETVIRSRAQVLDETARRHQTLLETAAREIAPLRRAVDEARSNLASLLVQGPNEPGEESYSHGLTMAQGQVDRAERALAERLIALRRERTGGEAGLEQVTRALPAGGALVAYSLYDRILPRGAAAEPSYMAFVLTAGTPGPAAVPLGPARKIDALIQRWKEEVGSPPSSLQSEAKYRSAASAVRRVIWDPLAPRLASSRTVLVVPDGEISLLNIATLPAADGRYLAETGPTLHYLTAERDLVEPSSTPSEIPLGNGLLAVGGADYDNSPLPKEEQIARLIMEPGGEEVARLRLSSEVWRGSIPNCASLRAIRFTPLPSALAEADEVAGLWKQHRGPTSGPEPIVLLTGRQAGEAAVKHLASGQRVVHLATHGIWIGDSCAPVASIDPPRRTTRGLPSTPVQASRPGTPLLSGLVLAGANRRNDLLPAPDGEDGILTAEEIASLDLRGVEWVVLSGCQTGVGPVLKGEGVFGLRRAFKVAGAHTLIMSLWSVSDHDARDWIRELYRARFVGLPTAEAVQSADRSLIKARRAAGITTHPFFWGAFVAAGDWR